MNKGASLISLIRRPMRVQSSSLIRPARMSASRIRASADSSRMTVHTAPLPCTGWAVCTTGGRCARAAGDAGVDDVVGPPAGAICPPDRCGLLRRRRPRAVRDREPRRRQDRRPGDGRCGPRDRLSHRHRGHVLDRSVDGPELSAASSDATPSPFNSLLAALPRIVRAPVSEVSWRWVSHLLDATSCVRARWSRPGAHRWVAAAPPGPARAEAPCGTRVGQDRRVKYALLICDDESVSPSNEVLEADAVHRAWQADLDRRGAKLGGARLRPVADATTVRVRDGETLVWTARSPRPRTSSAAWWSSSARTWTRRSRSPRDIPMPAGVASRSDRSGNDGTRRPGPRGGRGGLPGRVGSGGRHADRDDR